MGIWVDTDMGGDDIFALAFISREFEIDGVSLCHGITPLEQVACNAAGACAAFGWTFPVFPGSPRPVLGRPIHAMDLLGRSGIRTRGRSLPDVPVRTSKNAIPVLSSWLECQDSADILALGPLTNIAALVLGRPDLTTRISKLVWMGGARTLGNHTQHAEFNAAADPEALAILLDRQIPMVMIDRDACRQVLVGETDLDELRSGPGSCTELMADLLGGYIDIVAMSRNDLMPLYDPVAAVALARPELFEFAPVAVKVVTRNGEERGKTMVDAGRRNGMVKVPAWLDSRAIRHACISALAVT